jgi:hypothetical protein
VTEDVAVHPEKGAYLTEIAEAMETEMEIAREDVLNNSFSRSFL